MCSVIETGFREEEGSLVLFQLSAKFAYQLEGLVFTLWVIIFDSIPSLTHWTVGRAQSFLFAGSIYQVAKQIFLLACVLQRKLGRVHMTSWVTLLSVSGAALSLARCLSSWQQCSGLCFPSLSDKLNSSVVICGHVSSLPPSCARRGPGSSVPLHFLHSSCSVHWLDWEKIKCSHCSPVAPSGGMISLTVTICCSGL